MLGEISRITSDNPLSQIAVSMGVAVKRNGAEFDACCPFHAENTPSFTILRGRDGKERFHCFGCNAKGDVIDFVQQLKGCTKREAIEILGGTRSAPNVTPRQLPPAIDPYAGITLLDPGTINVGERVRLWNPKRDRWGSFTPQAVYRYRDGYVLRRSLPDGGKETPMVCRVRLPDGEECWSRFPFPTPRPLYWPGRSDGQVFIVEGEKCADAMAAMSFAGVRWCGGTHGVDHSDWSALAGRDVVIWPDADEPGVATARRVAAKLNGLAKRVRVMHLPAGLSKGFDVADAVAEGWDLARIVNFMKAGVA